MPWCTNAPPHQWRGRFANCELSFSSSVWRQHQWFCKNNPSFFICLTKILCSHVTSSLHDRALTSICGWHGENVFTDNDLCLCSCGHIQSLLSFQLNVHLILFNYFLAQFVETKPLPIFTDSATLILFIFNQFSCWPFVKLPNVLQNAPPALCTFPICFRCVSATKFKSNTPW